MNMKKNISKLSVAILLVVGAISCKKEKFNINGNPNQATDSTIIYNLILPAAENNTARFVARQWGWLQNYMGYWARSGTYAPNTEEETYQLTTNFAPAVNIWNLVYDNNYDYEVMRKSAEKYGADFYAGIARIMKAHNQAILVDFFNNTPYSEALKGSGNVTPKYDKGIDVYKDLLRQIDTGIALIQGADVSSSGPNKTIRTDDVMFGDKIFGTTNTEAAMKTRWSQFGNTLKLRLLVHLMNGGVGSNTAGTVGTPSTTVPGIDIPAEIAIIENEGSGFLGNGLNAQVNPGYATDKRNPFYNLYVADNNGTATANSVYYKANSYAIGYYDYNGDPREARFYKAGSQGLRGVQYGLLPVTENAAATLAGIGDGITRALDAPQWIFSAAESYFLQAEAMQRGFMSGDAKATMINGITESFSMLGASGVATYLSNNAGYADVDYDAVSRFGGAPGGLFTIISQKYFALNSIAPYEVYTDYRRCDFSSTKKHFAYGSSVNYDEGPAISVYPTVTPGTEIPTRLLYPQAEYLYNPSNVAAEGTIRLSDRVFWDLN